MNNEVCFACGRKLAKPYRADTRDAQWVLVGSDCYKHILDAGEVGYQPPRGGPRLWKLPEGPFCLPKGSTRRDASQ